VARGDPAAALALADRARSRVLLDTLSSTPPARLPASLPAGTALLEYVWLDDRLVVFAADRSGVTVVKIAANRSTIETLVATFRSSLARGDATSGAQLHALLIAPIAQRIARQPTLVIVPDGALHGVAFSALFDPQSRRYLIEDHTVIVAPSAAVYSEALKRRETRVSASDLLLVAQPKRGDVPLDTGEAEEITPLYAKVTRLTGAAASRAALLREVIAANVLHFAGHGITDARAGSALLLASSAGDSGIVDTRDIAALSLPVARTVVLAACSTAAARARSGREGVDSVARAFLAAGAPSVIATLWPIDDRLAAPMFVRIHRRLAQGATAADAVREAQLDAIRGAAPLPPSIWAAIQTIGS
jgi:CHAT domain-containing protein